MFSAIIVCVVYPVMGTGKDRDGLGRRELALSGLVARSNP